MSVIRDARISVPDRSATPVTISLIGKAIRNGSSYLPIRNYAASIAARAPRKDFPGQLKAIWDAFLKNWRYVRDPHGTETVTTGPRALMQVVMGQNRGAGASGLGIGDCDDATAALGALLHSVGFPIRIATTAPPGHPGFGFTHVFPQVMIGGHWITADPVLVPGGTIGDIAPHERIAIWDLHGSLIASRGVSPGTLRKVFQMQKGSRHGKPVSRILARRAPGILPVPGKPRRMG